MSKMNTFLSYTCFVLLHSAKRNVVVMVALVCLTVTATSCRSQKNVIKEIVTEYVHDTTESVREVHDTTRIVNVKLDSVVRFVERNVYVDTNGVVHEKEVDRLSRYIFLQDEYYQSVIENYEKKLKLMEGRIKEAESTNHISVEKKLNWFQKMMIWFGVGFVIVLLGGVISFLFYIKKNRIVWRRC